MGYVLAALHFGMMSPIVATRRVACLGRVSAAVYSISPTSIDRFNAVFHATQLLVVLDAPRSVRVAGFCAAFL